jgi:hypothetical protein
MARGCLPTVSCGILIVVMQSIAIGLLLPIVAHVFPDGLGSWWLLAGPLLFLLSIPLGLLLYSMIMLFEWLAYCWKRCPTCGARKWSWGFTRGFGI